MNDTDPALSLPDDQCVSALNVEWVTSVLAERRRGADAIDIAGSGLVGNDRVTFLHRHLPTSDEGAAELWALGVTGTSASALCRKTTSWSTVSPIDAITITGTYQYQLQAVSLHGKMFVAHKSAVNRLHVWDGATLRRAGQAPPALAPTGANTAAAGTFSGTRYYRTREIYGNVTPVRKSEPSPVLTFTPSGTKTGVTVTRPTAVANEGATHWDLEASLDNANFYDIARMAIATTTSDDLNATYATAYTLSEQIGDYTTIPSGKFLLVDEDRLIILGSFDDDTLASRMTWTPVYNDPGGGNDERIPLDPVSFRDLDTFEGGGITGAVGPVNGEIWIFKRSHIYKAVRTGVRSNAYDVICITKKRGALPGSMVEGVDQAGSPCVYFLDPKVGSCRIGSNGVVQRCGRDIATTWRTVNINAANVVSRAVFYDTPGQVHWFVATGSSDSPDTRLVLHVDYTRDTLEGVRRGWARWNGPSAAALAVCLYATNIDANTTRSLTLAPFVGLSTSPAPWRTDTADDDNGTAFTASLQTKPYAPASILNKFAVQKGAVLGKATADASISIVATRDFGLETKPAITATFTPEASESQVVVPLDDLTFSNVRTMDFTISDVVGTARWELNQLALKESKGQTA